MAFAIPSVASAAVISGVETPGTPPVPPANPASITRSTTAVFINFDAATAPCLFLNTTALRTEYAALGVTFAGPAPLDGCGIVNECGNWGVSGHSSPNFLGINESAVFADGGIPRGPVTMNFTNPVSEVSVLTASGSSSGMMVTMAAYDAGNALVAGHSILLQPTTQLLTVSNPEIVRVVISGPPVFMLDDLAFSYGVVPTLGATWGRLKAIYR